MDQCLKLLAKFYNNYRSYDLEKIYPEAIYKDLTKNKDLIMGLACLDNYTIDPETPVTKFIVQVISSGYVNEDKFIDVNMNLKSIQKHLKLNNPDHELGDLISILTGFKTKDL